jgi:hypothetical protein
MRFQSNTGAWCTAVTYQVNPWELHDALRDTTLRLSLYQLLRGCLLTPGILNKQPVLVSTHKCACTIECPNFDKDTTRSNNQYYRTICDILMLPPLPLLYSFCQVATMRHICTRASACSAPA